MCDMYICIYIYMYKGVPLRMMLLAPFTEAAGFMPPFSELVQYPWFRLASYSSGYSVGTCDRYMTTATPHAAFLWLPPIPIGAKSD